MKSKILLHKELYDKKAILDAISAFKTLVHIDMSEAGEYYELIFGSCCVDKEQAIREFENYVLINTIKAAGDLYA